MVFAGQGGGQTATDLSTEKALAAGIRPLKKIEICPPLFEGSFGTDSVVPSQEILMGLVAAKLKDGGVPYNLRQQHNEAVVDRHILEARKTTAWMHLKFQVLSLPDKKAYAFRIVVQVQTPVTHPGDPKVYVFANLYEDSKVVLAARDLTSDAIVNSVSDLFATFAERWVAAHKRGAP